MEFLFGVSDYLLYICKLFDYKETLKVYTVNVKKIMKKLIFIGLLIALFFTACVDDPIIYEYYPVCCHVLKNNSGHDLKLTLEREDTVLHYHLADNDSLIFDAKSDIVIANNYPSYTESHPFDRPWIPNAIVERVATLTFDDTCSHVSKCTFYYDSEGMLKQIIRTPEYWNYFWSEPFDIHIYYRNDTAFYQCNVTPAYYDHAIEQSGVSSE